MYNDPAILQSAFRSGVWAKFFEKDQENPYIGLANQCANEYERGFTSNVTYNELMADIRQLG